MEHTYRRKVALDVRKRKEHTFSGVSINNPFRGAGTFGQLQETLIGWYFLTVSDGFFEQPFPCKAVAYLPHLFSSIVSIWA